MTIHPIFSIFPLVLTASALAGAPAIAQHQGHGPGGEAAPADLDGAANCRSGAREALGIVALAGERLEAARQTNGAAAMRAALEDLQATLAEIKGRLTPCGAGGTGTPPPGPHEGHGAAAPAAQPASGGHAGHGAAPAPAAVDHSKMGHGTAALDATDPVCGKAVAERRHSTDYQGRTYYFCSEADRQRFVASPEKYAGSGRK